MMRVVFSIFAQQEIGGASFYYDVEIVDYH